MSAISTVQNGNASFWVTIRSEAEGHFTAQAVGMPEIQATASTREDAVANVQQVLRGLLASGQLVSVEVQTRHPLLKLAGRRDPNDPGEREFLEILAQHKREDLEQTLRELDQECSSSSSTPTT